MLCQLAKTFPPYVARLLERDSGLTRNFREETVTDLLLASMIGLQSLGVRVDFPDEPTTGGDMEWIYAAPLEIKGGSYLRLVLQAKRAQLATLKHGQYWYYSHLDHAAGKQAQTLVKQSTALPGTLPLYIFYHPTSALQGASGKLPAVEGVNVVFASDIAPIVQGGCRRAAKKVVRWRPKFLSLSDLLCWPLVARPSPAPGSPAISFLQSGAPVTAAFLQGAFHPDIVAERLKERREQTAADTPEIVPATSIPDDIQRAIMGETSSDDRRSLKRPRVVLSTSIRRADPEYQFALEQVRGRPS